ncbi:MAG: phospholipase D-like domain-containing protein [Hymenobacter sp.]
MLGPSHFPSCPTTVTASTSASSAAHRSRAARRSPSSSTRPSPAPGSGCGSRPPTSLPDEAFIDLLCAAGDEGVDVHILVNGPHVDKEVVREAGQRQYGRLLEAGVRVFEYQTTLLHAKVMIVDAWANIGSSSLEHRSLGLDDEAGDRLHRQRAHQPRLAHQFAADLDASEEFDPRPVAATIPARQAGRLRSPSASSASRSDHGEGAGGDGEPAAPRS